MCIACYTYWHEGVVFAYRNVLIKLLYQSQPVGVVVVDAVKPGV